MSFWNTRNGHAKNNNLYYIISITWLDFFYLLKRLSALLQWAVHNTEQMHLQYPQLNSLTVVVRPLPGSPLISCVSCVRFHSQLCMQSYFLIWQLTPAPQATINFTFNCQQVLITGITAILNVEFLLIILPVKKVNRPKEINITHLSAEISFGVYNLIFITCKYGTEVKKGQRMSLSFRWMWTITMEFYFGSMAYAVLYNRSFSKRLQRSCYPASREAPG